MMGDMVQTIGIQTADGTAEAFISGEGPGVLFFMDAIGLRPRIADMVDRIAGWGFTVLAPNVFHREGTVEELTPTTDLRVPENRAAFMEVSMPRVGALTADLAARDLPAYTAALRERAGSEAIGVTGYCMGARLALAAGCADPGIVAAGGFHGGRLATSADDSTHLGLPGSRAEFVFGHAANDASMPPEDIARLEEALAAAGLTFRNETYDGPHGYSMADTSSYDEASAERHFTELEGLLRRTLR